MREYGCSEQKNEIYGNFPQKPNLRSRSGHDRQNNGKSCVDLRGDASFAGVARSSAAFVGQTQYGGLLASLTCSYRVWTAAKGDEPDDRQIVAQLVGCIARQCLKILTTTLQLLLAIRQQCLWSKLAKWLQIGYIYIAFLQTEKSEVCNQDNLFNEKPFIGSLASAAACLLVYLVTWLILPVVICLSQRLSHACLSINNFVL